MSLTIKNLTKSFDKKVVFSDFNYEFSDTGLYFIRGESGVGKTTLLRMIAGLDKNYGGAIIGGGAKNVSFAFQEYRLFPNLCAIDNVCEAVYKTPSAENKNDVAALLKYFDFKDTDMKLLPSELSGGMKQRVSLVRAFLKKCPILILDEPTKELDAGLRKKVLSMIEKEAKERLVILVTHVTDELDGLNYTLLDLSKF